MTKRFTKSTDFRPGNLTRWMGFGWRHGYLEGYDLDEYLRSVCTPGNRYTTAYGLPGHGTGTLVLFLHYVYPNKTWRHCNVMGKAQLCVILLGNKKYVVRTSDLMSLAAAERFKKEKTS